MTKNVAHLLATIDHLMCQLSYNEQRAAWNIITALRGPDLPELQGEFKADTTAIVRSVALPRYMFRVLMGQVALAIVVDDDAIRQPERLWAAREAVRRERRAANERGVTEGDHIFIHLSQGIDACLAAGTEGDGAELRCWLPADLSDGSGGAGVAVKAVPPVLCPDNIGRKDGGQ